MGIAAVVALVALSSGLEDTIAGEFKKMGADKISLLSTMGGIPSPFASELSANPLSEAELETVKKSRGVRNAAGVLISQGKVSYGTSDGRVLNVAGMPLDGGKELYEETVGLEVSRGSMFRKSDSKTAILGSLVAKSAFSREISLGDKIAILGNEFKVIGIAKELGDPQRDSRVFIPLGDAREVFSQPEIFSIIVAQAEVGAVPAAVAEEIKRKIRMQRHQKQGEEDFAVATSEQFLASLKSILGVVQAVLVGVAAISLLVGGLGIMNTMYTSVVERTREIGIMKAIGARNGDVAAVFLIESGLLGAVGGILGILFGVSFALIAQFAARQAIGSDLFSASISIELLAGAFLFSFAVGALSGALPAIGAARLKPVQALRQ